MSLCSHSSISGNCSPASKGTHVSRLYYEEPRLPGVIQINPEFIMKHCTAHMHRIETGPVVLQSCFCPGFRVFHCCEGCGDKWASLSSVCHGHEQRPPYGKGSSQEQGRAGN